MAMPKHPITRPAATFSLMVVALLVAACGGSSTATSASTTTPTTPTTVAGNGARGAAFRDCMQSHGVTVPANARLRFGPRAGATDPTGSAPSTTLPPGVTSEQWQAALQACARTLQPNLQNNPQVQLYFNCLNSYLQTHGGTTLPPLGQGGPGGLFGGRGQGTGDTTTTNPALQAAQAHCAALRPAFGNRGSTTTTTLG